MVHVIERPARSAELLEARHRSGLGGESVDGSLALAEAGGGLRRIVPVGAVQSTVDLGQLVAQIADLEVAPHPVVFAAARLEVELAQGRRHFLHGAVVAERRVVIIRVDAPEQGIGRLVEEVAEQVLHRAFAGIRARRQFPLLVELAVHEERQTAIHRGVEGLRSIPAFQRIDRPVRAGRGQREVGDTDVEQISALELQVAKIQRAVAPIVEHRDLDGMCAGR